VKSRYVLHLFVVILVALAFALTGVVHSAPRARQGLALWYSKGVMGQVAYSRGLPLRPCMIASPHHAIGARVIVTGRRTGQSRVCVVYDVPQTIHRPGLIKRNVVAELDFRSAKILCGTLMERTRGGVRELPRNCQVTVRDAAS
jgi:hypothetical protein